MTFFSKYESLLDQEWSIDYWSDEILYEARNILNQFSDNDWKTLFSNWNDKNQQWQERCAETLPGENYQKSLFVLTSMLDSNNEELLETVVDAISIVAQENIQIDLSSKQLEKIQKLSKRGKIAQKIVDNLLKQLNY